MMTEILHRTPLFDWHTAHGGKMVPFAGWEMPMQYDGIILEHQAVRSRAGIFDVSHMGELLIRGPQAEQALDFLTCNRVADLAVGSARYSAILNDDGGVVDDIIVYRHSKVDFMLCVNAANAKRDFAWLSEHNRFDAEVVDCSSEYGQIALQGPFARRILAAASCYEDLCSLKSFCFSSIDIAGVPVIAACTGYTGEDGFEIFMPTGATVELWETLLTAGVDYDLKPVGLGARDTLRLEACLPLHGHELSEEISALESGLGWIVKFEKGDFIGREALLQQKERGLPRRLVGLVLKDKGIARSGAAVLDAAGDQIGIVTSGTKTPSLPDSVALAFLRSEMAELGRSVFLDLRGRKVAAQIVKKPFYRRVV